jgi:small-conductance mechanosensitive channel
MLRSTLTAAVLIAAGAGAAVDRGAAAAATRPAPRSAQPAAQSAPAPKPAPGWHPQGWFGKYLGEGSPYRGLVTGAVTLIVLLGAYYVATKRVRRYLARQAFKKDNARRFLRTWKGIWGFAILVFFLIGFSGSLAALGISAGFLGMVLGWSLQAPVTGLAAWLMIVVKKPFRIGDRVIIGGTVGDVTDITLTHVVLNQVGGTVSGEEQSGRGVLVPNAILFSQVITNYTLEQKHMLDEVPVRVSFDSDMDLAQRLLLQAVRDAAGSVLKQTGEQPFLRLEFYDAGVLMRLRYQTIPAERQRISSDIIQEILVAFKKHYPAVKFGYPHSVVRLQAAESPERAGRRRRS